MKRFFWTFLILYAAALFGQSHNQRLCDALSDYPYDHNTLVTAIDSGADVSCTCVLEGSKFQPLKSLIPNSRLKWKKKYKSVTYYMTPLEMSYSRKNKEAFSTLIRKGANPFEKSDPVFQNIASDKNGEFMAVLSNCGVNFQQLNPNFLSKVEFSFNINVIEHLDTLPIDYDAYDAITSHFDKEDYLESIGGNPDLIDPYKIRRYRANTDIQFIRVLDSLGLPFNRYVLRDEKNYSSIILFIKHGAKVNHLNLAPFIHSPAKMKRLLNAGATIDAMEISWGEYLRMNQTKKGYLWLYSFDLNNLNGNAEQLVRKLELVPELLHHGLDVNVPLPVGYRDTTTLLLLGMQSLKHSKNLHLCDSLIQIGADLDVQGATLGADTNRLSKKYLSFYNDRTPLEYAMDTKQFELAKLLIAKGVDVNSFSSPGYWLPLNEAIRDRNVEMIELLINNGAISNVKPEKGRVPLKLAKRYFTKADPNYKKVFKLLKHGKKR